MSLFDHELAFSRNLGWLTQTEQTLLKSRRVAIAGMGGVGGTHLLTLARLGIGGFHIADPDVFELQNFNRQSGATMQTQGQTKVQVMADMARDINPELDIRSFPEGIHAGNLDEFLEGVHLFVDGLDFFAPGIRAQVFRRCAELQIPAITAGPIGMGTAYLLFMPGGMSFDEYFRLEGETNERQYVNFLVGLTPSSLQRSYLVDPLRLNLAEQRGPSTIMGCRLATGVMGTEALKILLQRGPLYPAPWFHTFDAYRMTYRRGKLRWGNRGPLQTLKRHLGYRQVARLLGTPAPVPEPTPQGLMEELLALARWAPSGDNTQPWRFEIRDTRHLVIHGFDTRDHVIYDLQGHASQLALGALLETLEIAARARGHDCQIQRRLDTPETTPCFDIRLTTRDSPVPEPLAAHIKARCTNRFPLSRKPLLPRDRAALEASLGAGYRVIWLEGRDGLRRMARLLYDNAYIRLTTPEAYPVHRQIIQWNSQYSEDRLPDQALGMDPLGLKLMRWALGSWRRVHFLNTYLGGTLLPRLQMDVRPALGCAAHFVIIANKPVRHLDDHIAGGRAVQRFWLTATGQGLQFQPELTPLIFAGYVREQVEFTRHQPSIERAMRLTRELQGLIGTDALESAVFMGRIGYGPAPAARSLRLPLAALRCD